MNHFGKMMRKKRFGPVRNVMKILKRPAQGTSNSRFTTLDFAISRFTALFFDFTVTFTFTFNEIYWLILWVIVLDACCRSGGCKNANNHWFVK